MLRIKRWIPALIIMAVIFIVSSTPSSDLPDYGFWDKVIKKGGHMAGYGLLAAAYWYGFNFDFKKGWAALGLAVLYAISDEYHQSFTPGRSPSVVDVLLYDNGGAALGLSVTAAWLLKQKQKSGDERHI